jgi:hypothetical protein
MRMETTARFGLPLLVAGQGQKEITHNEALVFLDAMVGCIVEQSDLIDPPVGAGEGQCWLIPGGASGAWSGREGMLAISTGGGWRYLLLADGTSVHVRQGGEQLRRLDGIWRPVAPTGAPQAAIAPPTGGTVVDSEARAAIGAIVQRMQAMGLLAPF